MIARVRVTADDAAALPAIDDAILELLRAGILTHAAAFPNGSRLTALARAAPKRSALLPHLTLTFGVPITDPAKFPTLVNEFGQFKQPLDFFEGDVDDSIEQWLLRCLQPTPNAAFSEELNRQQMHFEAVTLAKANEVTFHHDIDAVSNKLHRQTADAFSAGRTAMARAGLTAGYLYRLLPENRTQAQANEHVAEVLKHAIDSSYAAGGAVAEAVFHPAANVDLLNAFSSYCDQRVLEYRALASPEIATMLARGRKGEDHYEFS